MLLSFIASRLQIGQAAAFHRAALGLALALTALAAPAHAQTLVTWTGTGGNANWSTTNNWSAGGPPTTTGTWGLTFTGTNQAVSGTVTVSDNIGGTSDTVTINNLAIIATASTAFSLQRANTRTLTLTDGGTISTQNSIGSLRHRLNIPVTLSGSATFNVASSGNLQLDGGLSGGTTLTKSGGGILFLNASNSNNWNLTGGELYMNAGTTSGTMTFNGGTNFIAAGGGSSQFVFLQNGTVRFWGGASGAFTSGTFNLPSAAASDITISLNSASGGSGNSIQGVIQDNTSKKVALNFNNNTSSWQLSGSNTYSGGTTLIAGGTVRADHSSALGRGLATINGNLNLNGLTATVFGLAGATGVIGSATNASVLSVDTTGQNTTFSGTIQNGSGTMGLTTLGTGKLTLGAASTYSGATTISGGTLALGSAGSIASSGTVTVGSAGSTGAVLDLTAMASSYAFGSDQTVRGIGTINIGAGKTVSSAGIWAPGNSIGSNAVTGNLTLTGTSQFELGTPGTGTSAPGTSDFTAVSGTLTLGGNLALIDNANAGSLGSYGAGTYRLFTYGAVSGSYASISPATASTRGGIVLGGSGTSAGQGVFLNVYNLAAAAPTQTVNLGSVYATNSATTTTLTVANTAASNATFTETLSGSFSGVTSGFSATGSVSGIAGGASNAGTLSVGLGSGLSAGVQTGTATLALFSNAVNSSGLAQQSVGSQAVTITGTVWNPAAVNTISPVSLTNVRVGGTFTNAALTITNTAASGLYTENLGATGSPTGLASLTGSVSALAGGSTSTAISVGLNGSSNTGSAGVKSGSATLSFTSTGGPGWFVPTAQTIAVTGTVFNYAAATIASGTTINLGTVLTGTPLSQALSITNSAPNDGYSEKLDAAFGTPTGGATTNAGSISLLAAGGTNSSSMTVGLGSLTAGDKSGAVQVNFTSNGLGTSGLGTASIGSQTVSLAATVLDPATAQLVGGSMSGSNWSLNLGEFQQGSGTSSPISFGISNLTQTAGFTADLFLASFANPTSSGAIFTDLTGTSSFATLASGSTNPFTAWMSLATTGTFTNIYNLTFNSSKNGTSLGGTPQNVTLTVTGVIVVPEPGALALAGVGIAAAGWLARCRRK